MSQLPTRKSARLRQYDYSTPGAYFITICTANREKIFWETRRGDLWSPANVPLSDCGKIVDAEFQKMNSVYSAVHVDKYCIMPDHVHMILRIDTDADGRPQVAPTISRVIQQFKGSVTKQVGQPIWQKSFYEHSIRNPWDYDEIWAYIENNPLKYLLREKI